MKVTLEFDGIEEQDDVRTALDGYKWKLAMWDLDQGLRSTTKYGTSLINTKNSATTEEVEIAEKLRELIRECLSEYNLKLE
jgi:hypothetical protein